MFLQAVSKLERAQKDGNVKTSPNATLTVRVRPRQTHHHFGTLFRVHWQAGARFISVKTGCLYYRAFWSLCHFGFMTVFTCDKADRSSKDKYIFLLSFLFLLNQSSKEG